MSIKFIKKRLKVSNDDERLKCWQCGEIHLPVTEVVELYDGRTFGTLQKDYRLALEAHRVLVGYRTKSNRQLALIRLKKIRGDEYVERIKVEIMREWRFKNAKEKHNSR